MGLPALPYADWAETRTTLHVLCQVVGKLRAALHPKRNHWWHVTLYVSPRGLTTRAIPLAGGGVLEVEIDLYDRRLRAVRSPDGVETVEFAGRTVADVYAALCAALGRLGVEAPILGRPFDLPFDTPFAEDTAHGRWDADALVRFHTVLAWSHGVFERFASRFVGKQTPVHLFWHSFDLALTRFNGRPGPALPADADPVTREAYSHEVVSFGFWPGDQWTPAPAFYAYVYPEPERLVEAPLVPDAAAWANPRGRGNLALLRYDDVRVRGADADRQVLAFLESAYQAAVEYAPGWDADRLRTSWASAG
jgi:hypothetical protein